MGRSKSQSHLGFRDSLRRWGHGSRTELSEDSINNCREGTSTLETDHGDDQQTTARQVQQYHPNKPSQSSTDYHKDAQNSLWDQASDVLKRTHPDLVSKFQKIVSAESQVKECAGWKSQLDSVIKLKLKEQDEGNSGKTNLPKMLSDAAKIAQEVSEMVALAVKNCPEASLAWSAVTLCLPFFTKINEATTTRYYGLFYIASRMDYFVALESHIATFPKKDQKRFNGSILELYVKVLEFQFRCIWRLYTSGKNGLFCIRNAELLVAISSWRTIAQDMLNRDAWTQKVTSIQEKEAKIQQEAQDCGINLSWKELSKRGKAIEGKFDELIEIQQQQQQQQILQALLTVVVGRNESSSGRNFQTLEERPESRREPDFVLSQEESRCFAAFNQINYTEHKLAILERLPGTGDWLTNHAQFHSWLRGDSRTLLLSGTTGFGKSVLAKFLIDSVLPKTGAQVCYFFFKTGVEKATCLSMALCALIRQLFTHQPALTRYAMDAYKRNRFRMVSSVTVLWEILQNASLNAEGDVVCVLDALDECKQGDMETLQDS
ncbi:hypothetical protein IWX90DRAFT_507622 [Phyllosticta citrichinensis]|uniref:NACHT domain-containing protein n=1 Tax=Phyllosticta citrichinensis TaxID=1130410 RepID=A0ABR1XKS1_9PEZI